MVVSVTEEGDREVEDCGIEELKATLERVQFFLRKEDEEDTYVKLCGGEKGDDDDEEEGVDFVLRKSKGKRGRRKVSDFAQVADNDNDSDDEGRDSKKESRKSSKQPSTVSNVNKGKEKENDKHENKGSSETKEKSDSEMSAEREKEPLENNPEPTLNSNTPQKEENKCKENQRSDSDSDMEKEKSKKNIKSQSSDWESENEISKKSIKSKTSQDLNSESNRKKGERKGSEKGKSQSSDSESENEKSKENEQSKQSQNLNSELTKKGGKYKGSKKGKKSQSSESESENEKSKKSKQRKKSKQSKQSQDLSSESENDKSKKSEQSKQRKKSKQSQDLDSESENKIGKDKGSEKGKESKGSESKSENEKSKKSKQRKQSKQSQDLSSESENETRKSKRSKKGKSQSSDSESESEKSKKREQSKQSKKSKQSQDLDSESENKMGNDKGSKKGKENKTLNAHSESENEKEKVLETTILVSDDEKDDLSVTNKSQHELASQGSKKESDSRQNSVVEVDSKVESAITIDTIKVGGRSSDEMYVAETDVSDEDVDNHENQSPNSKKTKRLTKRSPKKKRPVVVTDSSDSEGSKNVKQSDMSSTNQNEGDLKTTINSDEGVKEEENKNDKEKASEEKKPKEGSSDEDVGRKKTKSHRIEDSSDSEGTKKSAKLKEKTSDLSDDEDDAFLSKKPKPKSSKKSSYDVSSTSDSDSDSGKNKGKGKYKRIKKQTVRSSSDSDEKNDSPLKRKNIRKILNKSSLQVETKQALKLEEERKKRLAERKKEFDKLFPQEKDEESSSERKKLVLDYDPDTKEELVIVHPKLVKKLKPHQIEGVRFMWDNCFESVKRLEEDGGSGCILAHCMGLGKTLQVIALVHTIMTQNLGVNTVMVVCPLNTVGNWINEFENWLSDIRTEPITLYDLVKYKANCDRVFYLNDWHKNGGVLILSYDMFRNLTKEVPRKKTKKKDQQTFMTTLLDPGPDLIICDEGHLLKNEDTALSKCMKRIKTSRRVVLTGTPLQNNLVEYHCMVQFIKPNILGTRKEFLNRFVNPINNGQFEDSTPLDVRIMKRRSHVLHTMLDGCIQRFDYSVLTPFLPEKFEYVISIALTEPQSKCYKHYLEHFSGRSEGTRSAKLFSDYHSLQRIWTHPRTMLAHTEKQSLKESFLSDSEGSLKDFVVSDSEESLSNQDSKSSDDSVVAIEKSKKQRVLRSNVNDPEIQARIEEEEKERNKQWWDEFFKEEDYEDPAASNKLLLLFRLLKACKEIGDKLLVFSQSLYTLDLIEYFLERVSQVSKSDEVLGQFRDTWHLGSDYFRLDGSTSSENRTSWCKFFNNKKNTRARLFLISTKAGGLGINLYSANRVVIFDASWNPSHDVQSIFRVYRFGQKKTCFIYRFLAEATMEEKIYERQVTKLSLACRVVDEHQIERHYTMGNLQELYSFDPTPVEKRKIPIVPKDFIFAEILQAHKDIIVGYHEHDSLLENKQEEELTEEERKAAWQEFEQEKERPPMPKPFEMVQINEATIRMLQQNAQYMNNLHQGNYGTTIRFPGSFSGLMNQGNLNLHNQNQGMLNPLASGARLMNPFSQNSLLVRNQMNPNMIQLSQGNLQLSEANRQREMMQQYQQLKLLMQKKNELNMGQAQNRM